MCLVKIKPKYEAVFWNGRRTVNPKKSGMGNEIFRGSSLFILKKRRKIGLRSTTALAIDDITVDTLLQQE